MLAAREGYLEIVRMLLTAGADVDTRSDWGETALSLAQSTSTLKSNRCS
jgi:ankyrin repeat protein